MSDSVDPDPGEITQSHTVRIAAGVVGVVIVVFLVLLATRDVQRNGPNDQIVGQPSPVVEGESYTGEAFDLDVILAENRTLPPEEQTWTVVNFFASWCTPCLIEHPELIRFDTEGTDCPTKLVGVTIDDTDEAVREFFETRGGGWPVLVGDTNSIVIDFSVTAPPETLIIAPSGIVTRKIISATTYDELVGSIQC